MFNKVIIQKVNFFQKFLLPIIFFVNLVGGFVLFSEIGEIKNLEINKQSQFQQTNNTNNNIKTVSNKPSALKFVDSSVIIKNSGGDIIGTGFFVDNDKIVTGIHVATNDSDGKDRELIIITKNKVITNTDIIKREKFDQDIMVLSLNTFRSNNFIKVSYGEFEVGERVGSVCNIAGDATLSLSYLEGVISAKGRSLTINGGGTFNNLIQYNMLIERGCSGGPLINEKGEAFAVVFAKTLNLPNSNIGFAIPFSRKTVEYINQ